jgi:hypothetical protein
MQKKKINKELLMKQVATLEAAKAALEEECDNAGSTMDLEEIEKILEEKQTDLYLTSLGNVKRVYLNNGDARAGYGFAKSYTDMAAEELAACEKCPWLKEDEKVTLKRELQRIQNDMQRTMKNIRFLITDGKVQMSHDDRLEMLEGIERHVEMVGDFLISMIHETNALIAKRQQKKVKKGKLETA